MSEEMKLVTPNFGNLQDIPALLENLAAEIRSGKIGTIVSGACVLLDEIGHPVVCGWGRADDIQAIGLLHLGAAWLAAHRVVR